MRALSSKTTALVSRVATVILATLLLTATRAEPSGEVEPMDTHRSSPAQSPGDFDGLVPLTFAEPASTAAASAPAPLVGSRVAGQVAPPQPRAAVSGGASSVELRTLALMNGSRAAGGLATLSLDAAVSSIARAHSAVEARLGYVFHDGADGTAASRNRPACGSGWFGENTGKIWNGNADALHRYFMSEPWVPINHRTNIMDRNFRRAGIGAVQGPDAIYITVIFCR